MINSTPHSSMQDRDTEIKEKRKENADRKRHAAESTIGVGEEVYVKKVDKVNKLSSPFYEVPHTVVTKNGNDVEIENDDTGQRLRRYIVHLKRVEG
ncbi:Uncharacterized protein OBRU01_08529 [Operophtera brumata]|uniref:Uncharacterized protein n=1 Tax=Operophtera brumata TaxID=104452 RepID=A0A0L7K3W4_OPEBR|nr:Uncharacterized protein OBRU01_26416 [Operophtera brumata]KOB74929.1 Uncharacterized protein OBRU01_08529 [Operophtera brumata]